MQNTVLDDLAPVVGYTATRKIALLFGGRRLCVPRQALIDHALDSLLGASAFRALVREFGGEEIAVPSALEDDRMRRDIVIANRLAAGESSEAIAVALGLSLRRVQQIVEDLAAESWAVYAGGRRTSPKSLRVAPCRCCGAPSVPENLGTGEVFGDTPLPAKTALAA